MSTALVASGPVDARPGPVPSPPRTSSAGLAVGISAFAVLAVLIPLTVVVSGPFAGFSPALLVQVVILLHSAAGLALLLVGPRVRLAQFTFWAFAYVWFGLAGTVQVASGQLPLWGATTMQDCLAASFMIEVGLLSFTAALLVNQRWEARPDLTPRPRQRPTRGPALEFDAVRVLALAVLSIVVAVVLAPRLGGFGTYFDSRSAVSAAVSEATGQTGVGVGNALLDWGASIPAYWALIGLLFARFPAWAKVPRAVALVAVIGLNVVVNNPISQPRFWFGAVLLGILFSLPAAARIARFRLIAVGLLAGLVIFFPYSDVFRTDLDTAAGPQGTVAEAVGEQLRTNGDYDAYQQVANSAAFVRESGTWPTMALNLWLFWLPRGIWEDKPPATGSAVADFQNYANTNVSMPLIGEAYIWGRIPAVALALFLYGLAVSALDRLWWRNRAHPERTIVPVVATLAALELIILRGSLLPVLGPLFLVVTIPFLISTRPRANRTTTEK